MNINDFYSYKKQEKKISMITAYDYTLAKIINESNMDCILVGDSLAMVMHGYNSTISATTQLMALHTRAVSKGAPDKFIIADMPFLSFRKGIVPAMKCIDSLMKAGAHAVKLEGIDGHEEVIKHIVRSDIPVMGHLGLTPQSIFKLGGYKLQGKDKMAAEKIVDQAKRLEALGCFSIVLECIPQDVSKTITSSLSVATIGIGAGPFTDGQVLVLHDMLGLYDNLNPKFVKKYLNGFDLFKNAVNKFDYEIKNYHFPTKKESYSASIEV